MRKTRTCDMTECQYYSETGCVYFIVEGTTRLFKHLGENVDINDPCREYNPGERALAKVQPFTLHKDLR
jgi:hypothetical protein